MNLELPLTDDQIKQLQPIFDASCGGSFVLVANVAPNGSGWSLHIHALPAERRDAIREACAGRLTIARRCPRTKRKPKEPV